MLLTRLHATGLAVDVTLDGLTGALPPAPIATAAADALSLWRAALTGPDAGRALAEMGLTVALPEIDLDNDEAREPSWDLWEIPESDLDPVLAIGADEVHVDVSVSPDPPLFGRLREHAVRDPRLVTALGQDSELHVKVGLRRLRGAGAITLDLLGARVGDVAFPIAGKERPAWLAPFLAEVGRRVHRVPLHASPPLRRLVTTALARSPDARARWSRAAEALTDAFGLPPVHVILDHGNPDLAFGDEAWPARHLDRAGRDALHLVCACFVEQPDVLLVPDPVSADVRSWLTEQTQGDDAVLEQVLAP